MSWIHPYQRVQSRSSAPAHLTAPNGMNFSKSIGNPKSRLERVRSYLRTNGPRSKREILRDVFGKTIGKSSWAYNHQSGRMECLTPNVVTMGWATWLFGYGVRHGFFTKVRRGNVTYWSVN